MSDATTVFTTMPSPVGELTLAGAGDELIGLYFESDANGTPRADWIRDDRRLRPAVTQLKEYFAGRRTRFELGLAPRGTAFQKAVWDQLSMIPWGTTTTYGAIATALRMPLSASRAVAYWPPARSRRKLKPI